MREDADGDGFDAQTGRRRLSEESIGNSAYGYVVGPAVDQDKGAGA
jgi:hypothetical protein